LLVGVPVIVMMRYDDPRAVPALLDKETRDVEPDPLDGKASEIGIAQEFAPIKGGGGQSQSFYGDCCPCPPEQVEVSIPGDCEEIGAVRS
jgi:hypothetical protein